MAKKAEPGAAGSCKIMDLPPETFEAVAEFLGFEELMSWSCTNKSYRDLLTPRVFAEITLKNTEQSGASLEAIATSKFVACVKKLRYRGKLTPQGSESLNEIQPPEPVPFPAKVHSILSKLDRFPNLDSVTVEFPFENWDDFADPYDQMDGAESASDVLQAEKTNGWRALMAQSFEALSCNTMPLRHLEIRQLPPYAVSTFDTAGFREVLNKVDEFVLTLRGWDNGAGWLLNTMEFAADFAARLDRWFFNHLVSARSLVFEASDTAPIGLHPGRYRSRLAFAPAQMPSLRRIKVCNLFICPELLNFLVEHCNTLEEITIVDCMGSGPEMDGMNEGMWWHQLFNPIADAKPEQLRSLEVSWTKKDGVDWETDSGNDSEDEDAIEKARALLEKNEAKFPFNYTNLDDKYGMLFQSGSEIRRSLFKQDDQKAYDRLMSIAEDNRSNQGSIV